MMQLTFRIFFTFVTLACNNQLFSQSYEPVSTFDHEGGITVMTKDIFNKFLIAGDTKGKLHFHDFKTGSLIQSVKAHEAEITQLQFNSTGKLLISATHDGEIKIFDFQKDKIIQAIYSPDYSGIRFVLFSIADGFIYFNGNKKLFKTRSDLTQKVEEVLVESDTISDAVITNDRSSLIYASGNILKVMNTRTDQLRQEFKAGSSEIEKIALVKDTLLATWSRDGTIYFWHYLLGQIHPIPIFFLKAGSPAAMNFTDDGKLMSSGDIGNWARIWKPMERTILQELFSHSKTVTSTCFGENNNLLYTGSLDGKIILWQKGAPPPVAVTPFVIKKDTVKPEIKITPPPVPVIKPPSDVEMTDANIPKVISGRKVISNQKIEITSPEMTIYVYDNSYLDGDTMSLFFNGAWILDKYGVTKQKQPVQLKFNPNTNNYLVLFANNLGKSPPNTAAIEFDDGKTRRFFRLTSDLKSCSAINFYYKK
jgi:WD40 repeat protein